MMTWKRLILALPGGAPEDLSEALAADFAEDLLASWTALWHPELIHCTQTIPEWKRSDLSSLDVEQALVLVPKASQSLMETTLRERLTVLESEAIQSQADRRSTASAMRDLLATRSTDANTADWDRWQDDFFSLGFAYWQLHLIIRQLRYSSTLNSVLFQEQLLHAAQAVAEQKEDEAERWIQSCFDQLAQERDHHFAQAVHLVDVVLLHRAPDEHQRNSLTNVSHPQFWIGDFQRWIRSRGSGNQWREAIYGDDWIDMAGGGEQWIEAICTNDRIDVAGGGEHLAAIPWLEESFALELLSETRRWYCQLFGRTPDVYATFSPSLHANSPRQLLASGYKATLLLDWQAARYPQSSQAKIYWEAPDGSCIDAISNQVIDASNVSSFLHLGTRIGKQMDYHQVPTLLLTHWAGQTSWPMEDLVRVSRRSPLLGSWIRLPEYFASTQRPYHQERLTANKFPRQPLPVDGTQLGADDVRWRLQRDMTAVRNLAVLQQQLDGWLARQPLPEPSWEWNWSEELANQGPSDLEGVSDGEGNPRETAHSPLSACQPGLFSKIATRLALAWQADNDYIAQRQLTQVDREILPTAKRCIEGLRDRMPHASNSLAPKRKLFVVNPWSGARRLLMENVSLRAVEESASTRIYASHPHSRDGEAVVDVVVDVPPMGILQLSDQTHVTKRGKLPLIAREPGVLGNEFIEAHFDLTSGRLKGTYAPNHRGNRLSGMLALRLPENGSGGASYSQMKATRMEVLKSNTVVGRILFEGDLVDGTKKLGNYELEYSLFRGSRVLDIVVRCNGLQIPATPDLKHYLCWRTAWANMSGIVSLWQHGTKTTMPTGWSYCPSLLEIDEADHREYLLPNGISRHRRLDERFLDSLLPTENGEGEFWFGIGLDLPRPRQTCMDHFSNSFSIEDPSTELQAGPSAWFVQCTPSQIHVELVASLGHPGKPPQGMRIRLQDHAGRPTVASVDLFRKPQKASTIDSAGKAWTDLVIEDQKVKVPLKAHESAMVDILWE
jgi:alpha-mannosidase